MTETMCVCPCSVWSVVCCWVCIAFQLRVSVINDCLLCPVKAKFHYASRPASNLSATSFEPASVMEFGFKKPISVGLETLGVMQVFLHYKAKKWLWIDAKFGKFV